MLNVDVVVAFCDCLSVHVHCSSTDINLSLDPNQKIPLCTTVACTSKLTFSCTSVIKRYKRPGPILSVFSALIVHSELKSVHPGFPVAFIFEAQVS